MGRIVSILHYSALPVIGGVEFIIDRHSKLMREDGFDVSIIAGDGEPDILIPELKASNYKKIQEEILRGREPENFEDEVEKLKKKLIQAISSSNLLIVHNLFTMHFNLVATAALCDLAREIKTIGWVHDISYIDPTYNLPSPAKTPLKLITSPAPGVQYVTITKYRKEKLSDFFEIEKNKIQVIPNGIDPYKLLPEEMEKTAKRLNILSYYPVVLFPSRLTKRKNFELAIEISSELQGKPLLLLSAPPDPHNPEFSSYKDELRALAEKKELPLIFLSDHCPIKKIYPFYFLGDILLISSRMEGFGLPVLEASLMRIPAAFSNIPPLKEIGKHFQSHIFFDLDENPKNIANRIMNLLDESSIVQNRKIVIRDFGWDTIYQKKIKNLL